MSSDASRKKRSIWIERTQYEFLRRRLGAQKARTVSALVRKIINEFILDDWALEVGAKGVCPVCRKVTQNAMSCTHREGVVE